MDDIKFKITKYDNEAAAVRVTFSKGKRIFKREVNAVMNPDGSINREATRARVAEVATGVAHKMELGLVGEVSGQAQD